MLLFILWSDICDNIYLNSSGFSRSHTGITTLYIFGLLLHRGWVLWSGGGGGGFLCEIAKYPDTSRPRQVDSRSEIIKFWGTLRNNDWVMGMTQTQSPCFRIIIFPSLFLEWERTISCKQDTMSKVPPLVLWLEMWGARGDNIRILRKS